MVAIYAPGQTSSISPALAAAFDVFRARLDGELVTADDPTYDQARSSIQINQNRFPLAVVFPLNEGDVQQTVKFIRANNLPLALRSGDHGSGARHRVDGAVLVDMSRMAHVVVDPATSTARVQPGANSNMVAAAAHEHGLALSTGDTGSVGIGGLATGGGIGFMTRAYGLTIDNMISARVVTATGDLVVANAIENPDLFWAIRGGGGNFGIVTEFTFRLAPVDQIVGGFLVLPLSNEVVRGFMELAWNAPEELTTLGHIMRLPPMPFVPEESIGQPVLAILAVWCGDVEDGQAAFDPFRALATPIIDMIHAMPYPEIYRFTDHQGAPHGAAVRMMFADDLSDQSIDTLITAIETASSPMSAVQIRAMGGAAGRIDPHETAFSHRDQRFFVTLLALWLDPADTGATHVAWADTTFAAIRHDGHGVYVNFLQDEGEARIHEAYGETTYERLARIKKFYDPTNLFNHAQNIQPAV